MGSNDCNIFHLPIIVCLPDNCLLAPRFFPSSVTVQTEVSASNFLLIILAMIVAAFGKRRGLTTAVVRLWHKNISPFIVIYGSVKSFLDFV